MAGPAHQRFAGASHRVGQRRAVQQVVDELREKAGRRVARGVTVGQRRATCSRFEGPPAEADQAKRRDAHHPATTFAPHIDGMLERQRHAALDGGHHLRPGTAERTSGRA